MICFVSCVSSFIVKETIIGPSVSNQCKGRVGWLVVLGLTAL